MDLIMKICSDRMDHDCWGCPFKCKAGRRSTCMDWINANQEKATEMAEKYAANGFCMYDKKSKPYVGKLKSGKWQQICKRCQSIVVINPSDIIYDEYVEEYQYECPVCHKMWKVVQQKQSLSDITKEVMKGKAV